MKKIRNKGVLHRDLKPDNICYDYSSHNKFIKSINIIDFGLSTKFNYKNCENYLPKKINYFVRTYLFASTVVLSKIEQSQKDDLESLFLFLLYLKNGSLPKQKYQNLEKECYSKEILKIHNSYSIEKLFNGFCEESKICV